MNDDDFVISPPERRDPNYMAIKIYFFSKPDKLEIQISKKNLVADVINHILTMYKRNAELCAKKPL